jgi:prepilin signal peptidase PulO-like enzyme (type II secretory pathway)
MLCGVIAYAVAVEEAIAHPAEALPFEGRVALAAGLVLFIGGMAVAVWRARRRWLRPRLALTAATAILIVAVTGVAPLLTLAIALAGSVVIVAIEERASSLTADVSSPGPVAGDRSTAIERGEKREL